MKRLLPIIGLLLCLARPASATVTYSQVHGNAACASVSSCAVAGFSAVPAGSFIFAAMRGITNAAVTASAGVSGGGTWIVPTGCTTNADCHTTDTSTPTVAVQYILITTGAPTTLNCTATAAVITDCAIAVWTYTGTLAFDVGAIRDESTGGTSFAGTSAGTITGTSDIIIQYGGSNGSFTVCPNSAASPADFTNGNAMCGLVNSTNVAAGTWTLSPTGRGALGAVAFKETTVGGASLRSLLGVGK